jgi:hypothetical protein
MLFGFIHHETMKMSEAGYGTIAQAWIIKLRYIKHNKMRMIK